MTRARDPWCDALGASSDALTPSLPLAVKLGSIARHAEELLSPGAHPFDADAIRVLLADPDVAAWMREADRLALLPVLREPHSQSVPRP